MNLTRGDTPAPGPDCAAYVPLLPLLRTGMLDVREEAGVVAHVRTCRWCTLQRAAYDTSEAALRRYAGVVAASAPLWIEEDAVPHAEPDTPAMPKRSDHPQLPPMHTIRPSRVSARLRAGLAIAAAVLLVGMFAWTLRSWGGTHSGSHITMTPTFTVHVPASVYMVDRGMMYAIDASKGTQRWQTPIEGFLTPDPIIAHGVVYTTGIPNSLVVAQRASDGAVLWRSLIIQAEGKRIALAGDTLYMTTDMIGGEVLFPQFVHGVYALRASDGAIRWHHDTTEPVISPPLIVDGVIYAGVGTSLVALRANDGTQLWQQPLAVSGHPYLPLWLAFSSGTIYTYGRNQDPDRPYSPTSFGDATVFAVQAGDGAVRWSHQLDGTEPDQEVSTPVIADGIVYVRSNGNGSQAQARGVPGFGYGLHALRASDGRPLWTYQADVTQPVVAGGVVYASTITSSSGNVIALHGTDGTLIWKQQVAGAHQDFWEISPPAIANGTLYVASGVAKYPDAQATSDPTLKALRASDGQQLWTCPLPGSSAIQLGTPVFAA